MIRQLTKRFYMEATAVNSVLEKTQLLAKLPKGYSVEKINPAHIDTAASILAYCFTNNEPVSSFRKVDFESSLSAYKKMLLSVYQEGMVTMTLNAKGNMEGVVVCRNAAAVLAQALLPQPISPNLDEGFRALEAFRVYNYQNWANYFKEKGLMSKKILHIYVGSIHPKLRGCKAGIIQLNQSLEEAKRQGFERAFVLTGTTISASHFPPTLKISADEFESFVFDDPIKGKVNPFKGMNDWYNQKVNATRAIQGKSPLIDAGRHYRRFEGEVDSFIEYTRTQILS